MTVSVSYEAETKLHIPYKKIADDVVNAALEYLKCPYEAEVSVTVVDEETIKEINSTYRGIDRATDVLSFPMNEYPAPGDFSELEDADDAFDPETGELVLGDIILSADRIIAQAQEYGHTRTREYAFLVCHSILHLCGYDHMDDEERLVMEELQKTILDQRGYRR